MGPVVGLIQRLGWLCALSALILAGSLQTAAAQGNVQTAMQAAAQARHVPLPIIEAVAYVNTRWEWINTPAIDGGVGPMKVTPSQMALATSVSRHSAAEIKGDLAANFDAGAALIAHAHTGAGDLASWQPAVASTQGPRVAGEVFEVMRAGASRTTSSGEVITLAPQSIAASSSTVASAAAASSPDYGPAAWVPADPTNYSYANRTHDYPINLLIIHDIEGSASSAIQVFQSPNYAASAHYVIGYDGSVTQMVREHDIAWHAGNWDYNTRAIGIEHAGFAYANPTLYTAAEYNASALLAASICSRYGVLLDRNHVIGHYQVPDPNDPSQFGGADHHTDPGPYWDWTYYMATAQNDALSLPSPPHMGPDPVAVNGLTSATVTWSPAQSCRKPITGYTVTAQPGSIVQNLPPSATSATFNNLQPGTSYTLTVTAVDADGQDSLTSNPVIPGRCNQVGLTASPASPQASGTAVRLAATSASCANPLYQFWVLPPGSSTWSLAQDYSASTTFSWNTTARLAGSYQLMVRARDSSSPGTNSDGLGAFDDYGTTTYTLTPLPCTSVSVSTTPATTAAVGTSVTLTGAAAGCPNPQYAFWVLPPGSSAWTQLRAYGAGTSVSWDSTGKATGTYYLGVWARDASSPAAQDAAASVSFALAPQSCKSVSITAAPPAPTRAGTQVTFTASAAGCSSPSYEFWMRPANSTDWQPIQGYSASATYSWNSTGADPGTLYFGVWARDTSGTAAFDTVGSMPYAVSPPSCTSVTASASPAPPISHGTGAHVTFTAVASGCPNPNPLYEFWFFNGSSWQLVQGWSTKATYDWNTTGAPPGAWSFGVWVRDASSAGVNSSSLGSYDSFVGWSYTLN